MSEPVPDDVALRLAELALLPAFGRLEGELKRALSSHIGEPNTEAVRLGMERAVSEVLQVPVTVVMEESTQTLKVMLGEPGQ